MLGSGLLPPAHPDLAVLLCLLLYRRPLALAPPLPPDLL